MFLFTAVSSVSRAVSSILQVFNEYLLNNEFHLTDLPSNKSIYVMQSVVCPKEKQNY